jgi:predicted phage-related endonuclease
MKGEKMLAKLKDILSAERQAQLEKYASLKKVLKALRDEKRKLEKELENETDEAAKHEVASRLKVISKQRKKGLKVLQELKEERERPGK